MPPLCDFMHLHAFTKHDTILFPDSQDAFDNSFFNFMQKILLNHFTFSQNVIQ